MSGNDFTTGNYATTDIDSATGEGWPIGDDQPDEWPSDDHLSPERPDDERPDNRWPDEDSAGAARQDSGAGPVSWPEATPFLRRGPTALKNLEPAGSGYLDLRLPWATLTRAGAEPGYLTRVGPITPEQARDLTLLAAADPAVDWRVVITSDCDRAIAVTRIRSARAPARGARSSPDNSCSLLRRVTVVIPELELHTLNSSGHPPMATSHQSPQRSSPPPGRQPAWPPSEPPPMLRPEDAPTRRPVRPTRYRPGTASS
jgi:hypothetical protein